MERAISAAADGPSPGADETPLGLAAARSAYGEALASLDPGPGRTGTNWWLAGTGAGPDGTSVALLHGPGAGEVLALGLAAPGAGRASLVVYLAGAGLGEAQVLLDAGLACEGAAVLLHRPPRPGRLDPKVRRLGPEDRLATRRLAGGAPPPRPAPDRVHPEAMLAPPGGASVFGCFDPSLVAVALHGETRSGLGVAWVLEAAPGRLAAGRAERLLEHVGEWNLRRGGAGTLRLARLGAGPPVVTPGEVVLEHWQTWARAGTSPGGPA